MTAERRGAFAALVGGRRRPAPQVVRAVGLRVDGMSGSRRIMNNATTAAPTRTAPPPPGFLRAIAYRCMSRIGAASTPWMGRVRA